MNHKPTGVGEILQLFTALGVSADLESAISAVVEWYS